MYLQLRDSYLLSVRWVAVVCSTFGRWCQNMIGGKVSRTSVQAQ